VGSTLPNPILDSCKEAPVKLKKRLKQSEPRTLKTKYPDRLRRQLTVRRIFWGINSHWRFKTIKMNEKKGCR
jgi:hypothetical protein